MRSRAPNTVPLALCLGISLSLVHDPAIARPLGPFPRAMDAMPGDRSPWSPTRPRTARPAPAGFQLIPVLNCNDSGDGSLRAAAAAAGNFDIIDMRQLTCSTITLTTGAIVLNPGSVGLQGPLADTLTIHQSGVDGVLQQPQGDSLFLYNLSFSGGVATRGGCVYSSGAIYMHDVRMSDCAATERGGGVYAGLYLYLRRSTIDSCTVGLQPGSYNTHGGGAYVHGTLRMIESTLSRNHAYSDDSSFGGGAFATGEVFVVLSTIRDNTVGMDGDSVHDYGNVGAIASTGAGYSGVADSTISGNVASYFIGGLYGEGPMTVFNSTIAFNVALQPDYASGVYAYTDSLALYSTIISNNLAGGTDYDLGGYTQAAGSNDLIMTSAISPPGTLTGDPQLLPLQDNGGLTWTHAIPSGSIAIDAGNNLPQTAYDQRGAPWLRQYGAAPDIGAYERQPIPDRIFADGFDSGDP